MRTARIKEDGPACYHILSRVIDRRRIFDEQEKERFRQLLRKVEAFSGVQVLTYSVLGNHWHALVHVPEREELSDEQLLERLGQLYSRAEVKALAAQLQKLRAGGKTAAAQKLKAGYSYRMYDLSEFAKTLKQRFTQSYNRRHGRKGTLWEGRFSSVLLEPVAGTLATVGAYIDLNPVRAGLAADPKDYRFCGYAEAVAGSGRARRGIAAIVDSLQLHDASWKATARAYRMHLFCAGEARQGDEHGRGARPGFRAERVEQVLAEGGALSRAQLLRCRVRYFSDGVALGSRPFVEGVFRRHRASFSPRRQSGARPMRGGDWGGLCTLRRLSREVIAAPSPEQVRPVRARRG